MKLRGRIDNTQREIVDAFRAAGCTVCILSNVGNGVPDLLVGIAGHNVLVECKGPKGRLTPDQTAWLAQWKGEQPYIVRTALEAIDIANNHYRKRVLLSNPAYDF